MATIKLYSRFKKDVKNSLLSLVVNRDYIYIRKRLKIDYQYLVIKRHKILKDRYLPNAVSLSDFVSNYIKYVNDVTFQNKTILVRSVINYWEISPGQDASACNRDVLNKTIKTNKTLRKKLNSANGEISHWQDNVFILRNQLDEILKPQ